MAKPANVRFRIQSFAAVRAAYQPSPPFLLIEPQVLGEQAKPDRSDEDHDRGETEKDLERPEDHLSLFIPLVLRRF